MKGWEQHLGINVPVSGDIKQVEGGGNEPLGRGEDGEEEAVVRVGEQALLPNPGLFMETQQANLCSVHCWKALKYILKMHLLDAAVLVFF